jgi:hypothetical protein
VRGRLGLGGGGADQPGDAPAAVGILEHGEEEASDALPDLGAVAGEHFGVATAGSKGGVKTSTNSRCLEPMKLPLPFQRSTTVCAVRARLLDANRSRHRPALTAQLLRAVIARLLGRKP